MYVIKHFKLLNPKPCHRIRTPGTERMRTLTRTDRDSISLVPQCVEERQEKLEIAKSC